MKIEVLSESGAIKASSSGDSIDFIYSSGYEDGDRIVLSELPSDFTVAQFSEHMAESIVYAPERVITFPVPRGLNLNAYHKDAFSDAPHKLSARAATESESFGIRNVALNSLDYTAANGVFPHAETNIERDDPVFFPRNAIDGVCDNDCHGEFPYQSWSGGLAPDAELYVRFGREVEVSEIVFYLRADFAQDHDTYWKSLSIEFSDGSKIDTTFIKTAEPQKITLSVPKKTEFVHLLNLVQAVEPMSWAALSQIQVIGKYVK